MGFESPDEDVIQLLMSHWTGKRRRKEHVIEVASGLRKGDTNSGTTTREAGLTPHFGGPSKGKISHLYTSHEETADTGLGIPSTYSRRLKLPIVLSNAFICEA